VWRRCHAHLRPGVYQSSEVDAKEAAIGATMPNEASSRIMATKEEHLPASKLASACNSSCDNSSALAPQEVERFALCALIFCGKRFTYDGAGTTGLVSNACAAR